jgi:predicted nucleic acid-binding protein
MFLIESDVLYAIMKKKDPLKERAQTILRKSPVLYCSSVTLIEIFCVLKMLCKFDALFLKVKALGYLPNLKFLPVTPDIAVKAGELHSMRLLTFFDSFHAATSIINGLTLVSSDENFGRIEELKFIHVNEYISKVLRL